MNGDSSATLTYKTGKLYSRIVPMHLELGYEFDDIFEIGLEKGIGKNSILD